MPEKMLLPVAEVAELLGVSIPSVWRYAANGTIPKPIKLGGATRWRRSEIEALIAGEEA